MKYIFLLFLISFVFAGTIVLPDSSITSEKQISYSFINLNMSVSDYNVIQPTISKHYYLTRFENKFAAPLEINVTQTSIGFTEGEITTIYSHELYLITNMSSYEITKTDSNNNTIVEKYWTIEYNNTPENIAANKTISLGVGESENYLYILSVPPFTSDSFSIVYNVNGANVLVDPDVSACGTLGTANSVYNLTQNLSATGTCFTIGANNVTLQGNYYNISGDRGSSDYGIYNTQYNLTKIYNLNIYNFGKGIYLYNAVDYVNYPTGDANQFILNNIYENITTNCSIEIYNKAEARVGQTFNAKVDGNTFNNITSSSFIQFLSYANGYTSSSTCANAYANVTNNIVKNSNFNYNTYSMQLHVYGGSSSGCGTRDASIMNNLFYNNLIKGTSCIQLYITNGAMTTEYLQKNNFYNNTINCSSFVYRFGNIQPSYWNTTIGNYWLNSTGNAYSQTCIDADGDFICDSPYVINAYDTDYLPQATSATIFVKNVTINPAIINEQTAINCSTQPYSAPGGTFNVTFDWYKNGILQALESNTTSVTNNSVTVSSVISKNNLSYADNWTCTARSQQGVSYSSWINSSVKSVAGFDNTSCIVFNNYYLTQDIAGQPYITIGNTHINVNGSTEIKNNCAYTITTTYNITTLDANATCSNSASDCTGTVTGLKAGNLTNVTVNLHFPMTTTNVLLNTTIFYKPDVNNETNFRVYSTQTFNINGVSVQVAPILSEFQFFACQNTTCPLVISYWTTGTTLSSPYTYPNLQIVSGYLSYIVSQGAAISGGGGGGSCASGQVLCDGICVTGATCPVNNQTNNVTNTTTCSAAEKWCSVSNSCISIIATCGSIPCVGASCNEQPIVVGSGNGTIQTPQISDFLQMITANLLKRTNVSCVINNDNSVTFLVSLIMCEATGLLSMTIGDAIWLWIIVVGILAFLIYSNFTKKKTNWGVIATYGGALLFIFIILILNKISLNAIG